MDRQSEAMTPEARAREALRLGLKPYVFPQNLEREMIESLLSALKSAGLRIAEESPAVPEEWPSEGPEFNKWWCDAAGFVAHVQAHPSAWMQYSLMKYVEVRIDTRSGRFRLKDRHGENAHMAAMLKAMREDKFRGAYGEPPPPSQQQE